jgi:predicted permease
MGFFRTAAERVYGRLLRLYPGEFRAEFGGEMSLLFRDRIREESVPSLLLAVVVDTLRTAPKEHWAMWSQDIRYALRMMAKSPGFTLVAAGSLALGIGATSAVFSLADALLLRPLPVTDPGALLSLRGDVKDAPFGADYYNTSYPDYRDYRDQSHSFDGLAAFEYTTASFVPETKAPPQLRMGVLASGNLFSVLGVEPTLGRGFRPEEDEVSGRDAVVVLSHELWTSVYGADPTVVGRTIRLNGADFTVIGVAPARFTGVDQYVRPAFFAPLHAALLLEGEGGGKRLEKRDDRRLAVKGRLRRGVSPEQAQAELLTLASALQSAYPDTNRNQSVRVRSDLQARIETSPPDAAIVAMLLVLVGLVLLIACANVANLLLSRAGARTREVAVRLALGAGRTRLVRQLLTESLVLALLGGGLGLLLAAAGVHFFSQIRIPTDLPITLTIELDRRVLAVSLIVSIMSVLAFGLAPALQATRVDLVSALKASAEGSARRGRRLWGRRALVVAQVALSLVILSVAASLVQGTARILADDTGFRKDHLITAKFDPSVLRYSPEKAAVFYRDLVEGARRVPGVRDASMGFTIPMGNQQQLLSFVPEGFVLPPGQDSLSVFSNTVDDRYFQVFGVPLVKGRVFAPTDTKDSPLVAIVNQHLADKYWPDQDPLGKRIHLLGDNPAWAEVVGVARTHRYLWAGEAPSDFVYVPFAQRPRLDMRLLVLSEGDPAALAAPIRSLARSLDPDLPVYDLRTMEEFYELRVVSTLGMILKTVGFLGFMGLVLALVGLYGLVAYSVSRRTREIGIRMAIGAKGGDVLRMVLRQGLGLSLVGIGLGLVISMGASRLLASAIQGIRPTEPLAFVVLPVALLAVAVLATLLPARRAARVDPVAALHCD